MELSRRKIKFLIVFIFLLAGSCVFSYDNLVIHPLLTSASIKIYNQETGKELIEEQANWIVYGSIAEDTDPRYLNHYYDPSTGLGLNSGIFYGQSAKDWAKSQNSASGDYSEGAIFYNYRNGNYKRAYQGVGHILHLIQDMSVPAHTRNDEHATGDPFEEWAKQYGALSLDKISFISIDNLDQAFDELANYSHYNFFSKDTIESWKLSDFSVKEEKDIYNNIVEYIYRENYKIIKIINSPSGNQAFEFDFKVHSDYWNMLYPKAVGYSAGVLDYFLREFEKIDQEQPDKEKNFWEKIKNEIFNIKEEIKYNWGDISIASRITASNAWVNLKAIFGNDIESINLTVTENTEDVNDQVLPEENSLSDSGPDENIEENNFQSPESEKINFESLIKIAYVIDGDTFKLESGESVRYIGIDTPELGKPGPDDDECLAWVARIRNMQLLESGSVKLVKDPAVDKDKYGRLLRYVYVDNVFVNQVLANEGLAEDFFCQPGWQNCPVTSDKIREEQILASVKNAKDFKRGLFSGVCDKEKEQKVLGEKIFFETQPLEDEKKELENKTLDNNNFIFGSSSNMPTPVTELGEISEIDTGIIQAPNIISSSSIANFIFDSNIESASFEYQFDGNDWEASSSNIILENLIEDSHVLKVRAVSGSEKDESPVEHTWIVDYSLPESEVKNLDNYYEETGFLVEWQGYDHNKNITDDFLIYDVQYKINNSEWQKWQTKTASTSAVFSFELTDSEVCFQVRAIDYANNYGQWSDSVCASTIEMPAAVNFYIQSLTSSSTRYTASVDVGINYEIIKPDLVKAYLLTSASSTPSVDDPIWSTDEIKIIH